MLKPYCQEETIAENLTVNNAETQPAEETHELQADDQDPSTNRKLRRIVEGFYTTRK
jgi:hypothetical protein